MPRISPLLVKRALSISPHAATLLPACRDLPSAVAELRWIRDHVESTPSPASPRVRLRQLCEKRGRGVPLQYVLGSQPFGHLDIECRPGVLIPRPETEAYTTHLAHLINAGRFARQLGGAAGRGLRIADLCSGTGCIGLLLLSALAAPGARLTGVDASPRAVALGRANARRNPAPPGAAARFVRADVFSAAAPAPACDVLLSNPPYVSAAGLARAAARAVRNHEPRAALVPPPRPAAAAACAPEDVFYPRLLQLVAEGRPAVALLEVGGAEQAARVVGMAVRPGSGLGGYGVEIWRDWPDAVPEEGEAGLEVVDGVEVAVKGSGHQRSVLLYRVS